MTSLPLPSSTPAGPTAPRVLSLIPPMTQLNTPYPSTAYLTGFLHAQGVAAVQEDLALALVLRLLSREGLAQLLPLAERCASVDADAANRARTGGVAGTLAGAMAGPMAGPTASVSPSVAAFVSQAPRYLATIDATIRFLQGGDSTLAHRIASRSYLPEGPRFASLDVFEADDEGSGHPLAWAFGALGVQDHARHIATLYLNDLADVLRDAVDPRFEFVRYGERLAGSQASFDALAQALAAPPHLIDQILQQLTLQALQRHKPSVVLLSVPFPGSVYGALRIAQTIKQHQPQTTVVLGGGYVNTELRRLRETRLFDFVDFVTLDAGERPLMALLEHLQGRRSAQRLVRTFHRVDGEVRYTNFAEPDFAFEDVGTPTWQGLPLQRYLSLLDMLNPMHRLWSDGRWNKLTVAHGCYWKKCSFCDVSLDYISRYDAASAGTLVDRVQAIVAETGQTGFHLVDEAAPPKSLKAFAAELQRRQLDISWWGNIRFEKTFTPALCQQLADSGCIAISGGLEVASDRLLNLMQKGVSVAQVARVTKGFADAGVLVHAYLMYGFPTQTVQDTVDALDYVRQLFAAGCIHSGFWHRFTCTVHSPVGQRPQDFGVSLAPLPQGDFAHNDIGFIDPLGVDHDALGVGLKKGIYNFMHGIGLEDDVRCWWDFPVPKARVKRRFVEQALMENSTKETAGQHR